MASTIDLMLFRFLTSHLVPRLEASCFATETLTSIRSEPCEPMVELKSGRAKEGNGKPCMSHLLHVCIASTDHT